MVSELLYTSEQLVSSLKQDTGAKKTRVSHTKIQQNVQDMYFRPERDISVC